MLDSPVRHGRTQMPEWETSRRLSQIAQRWRQFAERRHLAFVELYESGDWKKHYSEDEFRLRIHEAAFNAKRWNAIAPSSSEDDTAAPTRGEVKSTSPSRTAA